MRAARAATGWAAAIAITLVVAGAAPAASTRSAETAVTPWIATTLDEIAANRVNPPRAARALALVSVAMRDSAFEGAPAGRAAVAGAASVVLAYLFPQDATRFEEQAQRARGESGGGFALGRKIGRGVVARGRSDGSDAAWTGTGPSFPGAWEPTPPSYVQLPLEPLAGTWRPWNLASASQYRPPPPPRPGSDQFARELREVYDVSRSLTDEQKAIASFWADGIGTVTPPGHWNLIALELLRTHSLDLATAAAMFATLNTAQADAFIACWDAKYAFWSMRPVTAIRRELDPTWLPYLVTPPFPSYVSGHSTTSAAAAKVLSAFFPTETTQLRAWAAEAALSRLYGGIHFRSDNEAGAELGRKVGAAALAAAAD